MAHIYDDFYIQCMLFLLLVVAIGFLFDVIVDPFKLESNLPEARLTDTNSSI